jgi:RNA-splicing ligase RtcB
VNLLSENDLERSSHARLVESFRVLMRTPTLREGALMPDACEAGPTGTIPVGGVAVSEHAIHPGMHSADICCSMFVTVIDGVEPACLLDAIEAVTHFGPGGRKDGRFRLPANLEARMAGNSFLGAPSVLSLAHHHLGTVGDGNHFQSVGLMGEKVVLTSHHGSRGVGAQLYKAGMKVAERYRERLSPETLPINAWIPADTQEGEEYWDALQIVRTWTRLNHALLHDAAIASVNGKIVDRFWNEHNFVFRDGDRFYHVKGATPVERSFLPDSDGRMIIPFNLAEPILIVEGRQDHGHLGFAPHGAGRNLSRRKHKRQRLAEGQSEEEIFAEETKGIDMRFHSGHIDVTELPSAYKPADSIRRAMRAFGLATVTGQIDPYGCIMAGDWERDAPWRRKSEIKDVEDS